MTALLHAGAALAALFSALALVNLLFYRRPPPPAGAPAPRVSVLIPARDEVANIEDAVQCALASRGVEVEVLVLDDHSTDGTGERVEALARRDERVRLLRGRPLAEGWSGKPHACQQLADSASTDELMFVDADVRLGPDAAACMVAERRRRHTAYLSGVPRQHTGSWLERLVVPLIHVVLLGYLPFPGVRWSRRPAFAAGCGQLVLVEALAYRAAGGHGAVRTTWHDGVTLPRALRRAGSHTDLADLTALASCRMYRGARETWRGFAKNAGEGMASDGGIVPWTLLLLGGHVLPPLALLAGLAAGAGPALLAPAAAGTGAVLGVRALFAWRFRQPALGVLLHPVGVAALVAIQWHAWVARHAGRPVEWKGRDFQPH